MRTRGLSVTFLLLVNVLSILSLPAPRPVLRLIDMLSEGINFIIHAPFKELNTDLFLGTLDPVEKILWGAKLDKSQIHDTVLMFYPYFQGSEIPTGLLQWKKS